MASTTRPGRSSGRHRNPEELDRLLEATSPQGRDVIQLALLTGMRKGEIRGLLERDCDFLREEIHIRESKTGESRIIPMHPTVKEILWRRMQGIEDQPLFSPAFHRAFELAVRRTGLRDLRFHDLRRSAASYLIMSGADPKSVQEILGHKDMRMTMDVYIRVSKAHVKEAIGRLRLPVLEKGADDPQAAKPSYNRLTVGKLE